MSLIFNYSFQCFVFLFFIIFLFLINSGDGLELCLPCNTNYTISTATRTLCLCTDIILQTLPYSPSKYPTQGPSPSYQEATQTPTYTALISTYSDIFSYASLRATLSFPFRVNGQPVSRTDTLIFDSTGTCTKSSLVSALYLEDSEFLHSNSSLTRYCICGMK